MKYYSERTRNIYEPLAWDHTSPGVNKNFLIGELEKSERGETTRDCRRTSCTGCGVCMNLGVNVIDHSANKNISTEKKSLIPNPQPPVPTKYRAQIRKGAEIAFLSHLEYMNVFMSALLRSKLPAAYSEGFNPHLKVSFATALGVGVTSETEYVDFELTENIKSNEVMARLNSHLPNGAELVRIKKIGGKIPALTAAIDFSRYEILIDADFDEVATAAKNFNSAKEINFTRVTPKHTREIEIKKYIADPLKVSKVGDEVLLTFGTKIFLDGTIKPSEVLAVLNLNIEVTAAKINRTALLSHGKNLLDVV